MISTSGILCGRLASVLRIIVGDGFGFGLHYGICCGSLDVLGVLRVSRDCFSGWVDMRNGAKAQGLHRTRGLGSAYACY